MKTNFWTSYFNSFNKIFLANVVFVSILVFLVLVAPSSINFLSWYTSEVPASLVKKDPVAYPHKHKSRVEYRYYADFYFEEIKAVKRIEIADSTHAHAKKGDVYMFSRNHKLQTVWYNTFLMISIVHLSVVVMSLLFVICQFLSFANDYFSVREETR